MSSSKSKKPRLYSDSDEEEEDRKGSKSSVFQRLGSAKSSSDVIESAKHSSSSMRSDRLEDREYKKDYGHESRPRDYNKSYDKEGKGRSKDYLERSHEKSRDYERSREYGREKDKYYPKDRDYEKDKYYDRGRSRHYTSGSTHARYDNFPPKKDSDKKEPCKFLFRNDFCNYGDNCIFYHDRERYEREFPHVRSDRDKNDVRESRGGYSKHNSDRDYRSKDSWYRSDHSQDRERGYSSSAEREDSAEKPIKSTISSAPKQEMYSSEESESDPGDLKTLEEKLQRYKEMASKNTTISVKKSGPRTPPERSPTPEPKGKVVKKKVKKKTQGSEEAINKKKKKMESGKKKVKRGSSLESSSHVEADPAVSYKDSADGEKKKKKVKASGEKGKSSTKTVKKKVKAKTEKSKGDVAAASYEEGEEVDRDREERNVKSAEKKRIKSRSYSSSSSSSGSSRSRTPSYDEPSVSRRPSATEHKPKARDTYSRSPSIEDSREKKSRRGQRGYSHETGHKEEKREEEEPKYRSDSDEGEEYHESSHYKEGKVDNSRHRHDSKDSSKYKHVSKSDTKYHNEKRDDSKYHKDSDYRDDSKYPDERRRHDDSKYRDSGKYHEDGKYADEGKYRDDSKYRADDYKYKDDYKYREDRGHDSKYGKDEKSKGYREARRDDFYDDRKGNKKDYTGKDDRRDYSSSKRDDRRDDSRGRRDDERYEKRDDRYRYDDNDKRDRQSERGKEREDKYGGPARSLHQDKGDRSRHPSPGNRLSPMAIPNRSRSPGDRRITSPSYRRPSYPDYTGQRDRPPVPAPTEFYDRNRPAPFYAAPDAAYRGRGREAPYPDRRADGLPYDRYNGPTSGPTDHYGGPPPPHMDDRYAPPEGRGGYRDFFRGRGRGRGLGRGRGGYGYEGAPRDGHYEEGAYTEYEGERRYKRDRSIGSDRQMSPDRKRRRDESDKRGSSRDGRDGGDYSRSPRERPRKDTDEPDSGKSPSKERKISETSSVKDPADLAGKSSEGLEQEVDEDLVEEKKRLPVMDVVGILDIDWKSLISSTKPVVTTSSDALDRFTPANMLRQLGVSRQYAGADAAAKVEELTGDKLKDDLATIHLKKTKEEQQRKEIFKRIGPNRKALCARYDLAMRRQFNYLSPNESTVVLDPITSVDKELVKQSMKLLTGKTPELVHAAS